MTTPEFTHAGATSTPSSTASAQPAAATLDALAEHTRVGAILARRRRLERALARLPLVAPCQCGQCTPTRTKWDRVLAEAREALEQEAA